MEKQNSVVEILEEVCQEFCDKYCKHPSNYTTEEWETKMDEICDKCPLNRLV